SAKLLKMEASTIREYFIYGLNVILLGLLFVQGPGDLVARVAFSRSHADDLVSEFLEDVQHFSAVEGNRVLHVVLARLILELEALLNFAVDHSVHVRFRVCMGQEIADDRHVR
ncbi:hypothetical protein PMAYCL1PPCAC_19719, partial [Pristionchus mayeri]